MLSAYNGTTRPNFYGDLPNNDSDTTHELHLGAQHDRTNDLVRREPDCRPCNAARACGRHFGDRVQQQQQQQQFQQQLQFNTFMAQQAEFQRQVLTAQTQARMPHKKKGDLPTFNGKASEDLELWIFSTEQYYAQYRDEMNRDSSDFVDTIFANLGPSAQTWFRDFKLSLGQDQPATWSLFKTKIRERFRDSDFQQKVMSKLYELRWQGSQQEYTTRFLHLLSQLEEECPEFVKR
jgi:hypothetical protein